MPKKNKKKSVLAGTLSKHKNGFGFVDVGEEEEVFIPREGINGAMDGDVVEIDLLPSYMWDRRKEAIVTRIRERAVSEVIGTFHRRRRSGFVVPEGKRSADDIFVEKKYFGDADDGDKVVVKIVKYPTKHESAEGKIVEIIGRKGSPGSDITALVRNYGIEQRFPQKVLDEAQTVSSIPVSIETAVLKEKRSLYDCATDSVHDVPKRRDLREITTFTIDGADARDFDDAVSCELLTSGNYLLRVHIADVSHYVKDASILDREAERRGTSIYLPDRVIPMLPEELSNGICSLNPGEDRLTMTCEMEINSSGRIVRHDIYESVIRSSERLVYEDVTLLIDGAPEIESEDEDGSVDLVETRHDRSNNDIKNDCKIEIAYNDDNKIKNTDSKVKEYKKLRKKYDYIYDDLMLMKDLARILEKRRKKRGSIDFDLDEPEIRLDSKGTAVYIGAAERGTANKMIEEFMLAANETVAEHFYHLDLPFIYRVHESPELAKMHELELFLSGFGINIGPNKKVQQVARKSDAYTKQRTAYKGGSITPLKIADILDTVKGRPYENVVSTVLLRSMQKAMYDPECKGHFGLALRYYCHFTSPIRRYPDLMIHRVIKEHLAGRIDPKRYRTLSRRVCSAADSSSFCERQAIELERDVANMKKAEYMRQHIGEKYDGIISGVTSFGIFVQLTNTVEGLIRFEDMGDDYYDLDERHYCVTGRSYGKKHTLGDRVKVKVKSVDMESHEINFSLM